MTDYQQLVHDYLTAWNATDPAARRAAIARVYTEDARYADPLADVTGHDQLDALIAAAHDQFPGFVFTPMGSVDGHHDQARFTWGLGPAGAEPVVVGSDVVTLAEDGRISLVLGFLDRVPAAA
jgi:hypothetical protein